MWMCVCKILKCANFQIDMRECAMMQPYKIVIDCSHILSFEIFVMFDSSIQLMCCYISCCVCCFLMLLITVNVWIHYELFTAWRNATVATEFVRSVRDMLSHFLVKELLALLRLRNGTHNNNRIHKSKWNFIFDNSDLFIFHFDSIFSRLWTLRVHGCVSFNVKSLM